MNDSLISKLRARAADARFATDEPGDFPAAARSPLDAPTIARAEIALGRRLPDLLRAIYTTVGDGGFGPGYGLLRLMPDSASPGAESVVGLYEAFCGTDPEDPAWAWPVHLVPFCDWGCAIRSCVDCSAPDGAVITFDPNARDIGEPMSQALAATHPSLESWFVDWLAGVRIWDRMFEPDPSRAVPIINPFTKESVVHVPTKPRRGGLT